MHSFFYSIPHLLRVTALPVLLTFFIQSKAEAQEPYTIRTDQADYPPGATVIITGTGWLPGEEVVLQVVHADGEQDNYTSPSGAHDPWVVVADGLGEVHSMWYVPTDEDELGATLLLTADGRTSGGHAEWIFTDANVRFQASGLPPNTTVGVTFSVGSVNGSYSFSTGPSGNGTSSTAAITGVLTFSFTSPIVAGGTTYILDYTTPVSPATIGATGATTIVGTYIPQSGSGGLTVTAPVCAQGGSFTITYTPASGSAVTETRSTPFSFNAKKNTAYSITAIASTVNGNSYSGGGTITGTTPNTNDFTQTVTLTYADTRLPSLTVWDGFTVDTDFNDCTASIAIPDAAYSDNCAGTLALTWSMTGAVTANGSGQIGTQPMPKGNTNVTYTVTDAAGNSRSSSTMVTVMDNQNPILTVPDDVQAVADFGQCHASGLNLGNPSFSDNCPGAVLENNAPAQFPVGLTEVLWTVTDESGNTAHAVQKVLVRDEQPPMLVAPPAVTVGTDVKECSAEVKVLLADVSDNCGVESFTYRLTGATQGSGTGQVGTRIFGLGLTTITFTAEDEAGNQTTATTTVTVNDTEYPVIEVPGDFTLSACEPVPAWSVTVTDNCSAVSSPPSYYPNDTFAPGTTTIITYTATDGSGNTANNSFSITRATALTAQAVLIAPVACNGGTATVRISGSGGVAPYSGAGDFSVTAGTHSFTVTDAAGCTSTTSVTVTEPAALTATFSTNNTYLYYGYSGDQTATLTIRPSGGQAPYRVTLTMNRPLVCNRITSSGDEQWNAPGGSSTGQTCPVSGSLASAPVTVWNSVASGTSVTVNVMLMADARFTLSIEDAAGCVYNGAVLTGSGPLSGIDAEDVRCFTASLVQKVQICHRTGSAKNPCVTICVDESAVAEHIAHGDFYGKCTTNCFPPSANARDAAEQPAAVGEVGVSVFPNPFAGQLTVRVDNPAHDEISMDVIGVDGRIYPIEVMPGEDEHEFRLDTDALPPGMHVLRVNIGKQVRTTKIIRQ